jgi:hypothetical protein
MILKGSQRANGADLAIHLMNALDNEGVEIAQVRGTVAGDLYGAFAEFEAVALGTRAQKPLYSLSINPSSPLTRDQYLEAIGMIEKRLRLSGQPRAIVFHIKDGRQHCHVVWSRIDVDRMRAIHMAHDKRRLMDCACEIAHRFGLELPPGLKAWEEKQAFKKDRLEPSLGEKAQAEATGISPEQRRADITAAYENSDSGAAFVNALEEAGYVLARGDRRGFVVVDCFGNPHSLTRYVKDHSAKDVKAKLATIDPATLPDVEQAKEIMRARMQAHEERAQEQAHDHDREQNRARRHGELNAKQQARRGDLAGREQDLLVRQAGERLSLHAAQKEEAQSALFRIRRAVAEFIGNTPGLRGVLGPIQKLTGLDPAEKHRLENEALARRHGREKLDIAREKRTLDRLETRERQALEKRLRKEEAQGRALGDEFSKAFAGPLGHADDRHRDDDHRQHGSPHDDGDHRHRPLEWGELTDAFNSHAADDDGSSGSGGDDDDGPHPGHDPDGPDNGPRRRRKKGYGYRRDE